MARIAGSGSNTLLDDEGHAVLIGENTADRLIEGGDSLDRAAPYNRVWLAVSCGLQGQIGGRLGFFPIRPYRRNN